MTFAEKVKKERVNLGYSQTVLADMIGVSLRTITSYEKGEKKPRPAMLAKLAAALKVSVKYLTDTTCDNPVEDIDRDASTEEARSAYGAKGATDVDAMLRENSAPFAGGELSQEQKDAYFEAIMKCYLTSKELAKEKFGRKKAD